MTDFTKENWVVHKNSCGGYSVDSLTSQRVIAWLEEEGITSIHRAFLMAASPKLKAALLKAYNILCCESAPEHDILEALAHVKAALDDSEPRPDDLGYDGGDTVR